MPLPASAQQGTSASIAPGYFMEIALSHRAGASASLQSDESSSAISNGMTGQRLGNCYFTFKYLHASSSALISFNSQQILAI